MNFQLVLLTLCQGFFLINNVTFIAINGLVGLSLAPTPWLATLPVMGYVAGGALFTALVARHPRAWGRRRTFQTGLAVAILSTALCAYAASTHDFWLLVAATVIAGYYNANAGLYRFAATELVSLEFKERAISWVLAGGIIGAVIGPNLANVTRDALPVPFAGAYAALVGVALASLAVMSFIDFPPLPLPSAARPGRLHRGRAVGRRSDAVPRRIDGAGARLEFPLHRRHDAVHRGVPARRENHRASGDGLLRLPDHDHHVVQLRRADHDAGLDLAQRRLAAAGDGDDVRARLARAVAACGGSIGGDLGLSRRLCSHRPGDQIELEQPTFDRPVPHHDAPA